MTAPKLLGVCRWMLECPAEATEVVTHSKLGEYPCCGEHAKDHRDWEQLAEKQKALGRLFIHADGQARPEPPNEPGPECYCPDQPRVRVPYCPQDGTREQRGIDPLADEV